MKTIDEILGDTLEIAVGKGALSCAELEDRLAQTIHGQAPIADEAVRAHLAVCASCQELAETVMTGELGDALVDAGHGPHPDHPELPVVPRDVYERGREVGRGGMGRVTRARNLRLGRMVVLKELHEARLRERFEREARLTARLQHPGIVNVLEAGRWPDGEPFYAMKYVAGRSLSELIADEPTLAGRMKYLPNLIAAVEAVAYAHAQRVIHRDLKPHNILVGPFGETVVVDWGLAKGLEDLGDDTASGPYRGEDVALTRAGAGTPRYMPPEQAAGELVDERADVYALGATLHHLLAGKAPGSAELSGETPAELAAIVAKAMAPSVEARYRDAGALATDLSQFQTGQLVSAHQYSLGQLVRRFVKRNRVAVRATLMVVSSLLGIGGISVMRVVDARGVAESRRVEAESREATLLVEQARQDVLAGRMDRARQRLAAAKRLGESGPVAAFLAGEIARKELVPLGANVYPGRRSHRLPSRFAHGFTERSVYLRTGGPGGTPMECFTQRDCITTGEPSRLSDDLRMVRDARARASAAFNRFITVETWAPEPTTISVWNGDGTLRWRRNLDAPVLAVDLSDDGSTVAARFGEDKTGIFDASNGEPLATLDAPGEHLRLAADGRGVVVTDEGIARLFDLDTGSARELRVSGPPFNLIELSPDGRHLLLARSEGLSAYVFAIDGSFEVELRHEGKLVDAGWVPGSGRAFTASAQETRLWTEAGTLVLSHPSPEPTDAVGFSADGRVLTHYQHLRARRWLLPPEPTVVPGVLAVTARDEEELAWIHYTGMITIARHGQPAIQIALRRNQVVTSPPSTNYLMAVSAGRWVLLNDANAIMLDPAAGSSAPILGLERPRAIHSTQRGLLLDAPAYLGLVVVDGDGRVTSLPALRGQRLEMFSPDGRAAQVKRGSEHVWLSLDDGRPTTPSLPRDWTLPTLGIDWARRGLPFAWEPQAAIAPRGLRAVPSGDGRVDLWIGESLVATIPGFRPRVNVAFSPAGDRLLILDEDGLTVRDVSSR